jgi:hypothetical protein
MPALFLALKIVVLTPKTRGRPQILSLWYPGPACRCALDAQAATMGNAPGAFFRSNLDHRERLGVSAGCSFGSTRWK